MHTAMPRMTVRNGSKRFETYIDRIPYIRAPMLPFRKPIRALAPKSTPIRTNSALKPAPKTARSFPI